MVKRVSMASSPFIYADEDAKMESKHQSLLQDFHQLQKENKAIKKRFLRAKKKKLTLLAEIRFLRSKYQYFLENPPQSSEHREIAEEKRNYCEKEVVVRPTSTTLDSNQTLVGERSNKGVKATQEPLTMEKKLKRCSGKEETFGTGFNISSCIKLGKGSNQSRKKRVTWQDQVALRV